MAKEIAIVHVKTEELRFADYNPRKANEFEHENLVKSVKKYGIVDPIIVNAAASRRNIIIGGHFRVRVARELGLATVPVVYLDIPDEKVEKELNVRLNKNTGSWDEIKLADMDKDILSESGFGDVELDRIFAEMGYDEKEISVGEEVKIKCPSCGHEF
jgi:ParB/RepB/Spo0J family partition protein